MGAVVHHIDKTALKTRTLNYIPQTWARRVEVALDVIWCFSSAAVIFFLRMSKHGGPLVVRQSCGDRPVEMSISCVLWGKQSLAGATAKRMCVEWEKFHPCSLAVIYFSFWLQRISCRCLHCDCYLLWLYLLLHNLIHKLHHNLLDDYIWY